MAGYYILRHSFPVDTSGLADDAVISAATFYIKGNSVLINLDNDAQAYLAIVQTTTASDTTLATSDWDNFGTTKGSADVANSGLSTSAYNTFTLNSTGRGWINKTGYTKLAILEGHDIENVAVAARNSMGAIMSETAGTGSDPYLEVTYTVASTTTPTRMMMGMGT